MKKLFVLGINGSAHKNGHIASMLEAAIKESRKTGAEVRIVNLVDYTILPHSGKLNPKSYKEKTADDMSKLQELVLKADGIIFATPTHWFSSSSLMKLFIDRLTSLEDYGFLLEGKAAGFITYGPEGGAANNAMQLMMIANHWGMVSPPYACVFDEDRKDAWIKKDCKLLGKNMVKLIRALRASQVNWDYEGSKYKVSPIELLDEFKE